MKSFIKVIQYITNYKGYAVLNVICNLLSIVFSVFSITLIAPVLNLLFMSEQADYEQYVSAGKPVFSWSFTYGMDAFNYELATLVLQEGDQGKMDALFMVCVAVAIAILGKNLFAYGAQFFIGPLRQGIIRDLRNDIYKKILELPLSYFSEQRKGDVIAKISNDVKEVEWSTLNALVLVFRDPITIVAYLAVMVYQSPELSTFVFILLPITGAIIGLVGKSLRTTSKETQDQFGRLISIVEETLGSLKVVKAFNAENKRTKIFEDINEKFRKLEIKMYRKRDLASPLSEVLGVGVMVLVIWYGGSKIIEAPEGASITAASFIVFIGMFSQLIAPAKGISTAYAYIQKGAASIDRINEILLEDNKIEDAKDCKELTDLKEGLTFDNVHFDYGKGPVLSGVSLTVKRGETVAIVGASGGGKTTLVDLVPRYYDVTGGRILIDGVNIKDVKLRDLRSLMGIVTQESLLFNDSVENNVALGTDSYSEAELIEAAKIANAFEFVDQLPNKFGENIGDSGSKLSGGQKQRLGIARAILKNPPILILDEATSALDTESEKLVQDAIDNLMANRTVLVIAHRLSTIQSADKIIVLDKGVLAEQGTHADLLAQGGIYKRLHDMQSFQ